MIVRQIGIYFSIIILYLSLATSFSPTSQDNPLILKHEQDLFLYFDRWPASYILIDAFKIGFVVKTYFHKYRIVAPYQGVEEITVATTKEFWQKNLNRLGLEISPVKERIIHPSQTKDFIGLPPGSSFIDDHAFGHWAWKQNEKIWRFHQRYRYLPYALFWGDFRPTERFYLQIKEAIQSQTDFAGTHNEFGPNGPLTKKFIYSRKENREEKVIENIKDYFAFLLRKPAWFKEKKHERAN